MIAYQRFVALAAVWSARFSTFVVILPVFSIQRPSFYSRICGQVVLQLYAKDAQKIKKVREEIYLDEQIFLI